jgi:uncharacterized membrane protein YfhO
MPKRTSKIEKQIQLPKKSEKNQTPKMRETALKILTFDDYFGKKGLLLAVSLILITGTIVFKDFIFMKFVYFFKDIGSDSVNVDYPASVLLQNMYREQHYFTWSFYAGMGYPVNSGIANPQHPLVSVNTVLMPLFKTVFGSNPAFLKFPVFFTILILTGITAFLYFKTLEYSSFVSIIGCLLITFMGYNIASSAWNHYYDVFYGIFLLFAFEQFYKKNRWYFLPIAVMMISQNFFNIYVYGVFLITYIIFRYFSEQSFILKKLITFVLKIAALSVFGLMTGIANFAPNLVNALNSPRVSENVNAINDAAAQSSLMNNRAYEFSTAILRTFSSDAAGTGNDFKGWYNYLEAPLFYCGLISLILAAQIFIFLTKKDKIIFGTFAGLWFTVVLIPELRHAFHLYLGNYYKVGINFFIPVILIFYGIRSMSLIIEKRKINIYVLVISTVVLLIALFYPYKISDVELTDKTIRNYAALLLILYSGLIYFLSREKYQLPAQIAILVLLFIELTGFSEISVSRRTNYTASEFRISEAGYNDNTMPTLDFVKTADKNFYRLEKDYSSGTAMHGSLNDSQAQGYFGTTLYSSYNQPYYVDFLRAVGIIKIGSETETRWAPGLRSRPLLQTFASIKYNLSKSEKPFLLNSGYSSVKNFGDVKLLKNNYFIPFGYCYSSYITKSDFMKCSSLQKDITLLRAFVADENTPNFDFIKNNFKKLNLTDTVSGFNFEKYKTFVDQRRKDTLQITQFKQNFIKGNLKTDSAEMFFLSIPYDKYWTVKIDGKSVLPQIINIGFLGINVSPGNHAIEAEYFPNYLYYSIIITILSSLAFLIMLFLDKEMNRKVKIGIAVSLVLIFAINLF